MSRELFESVHDIPETVSIERRFSLDDKSFWAPVNPDISDTEGITPVELSFIFLGAENKPRGAKVFKQYFVEYKPEDALQLVKGNRPGHIYRALARVMMHWERIQPFNLTEVYDTELTRSARFPAKGERAYFEHFIDNWSVLKRS
ncbi:MAG: hypothetical protein ACXWLH_02875 [Candidatus Saccharimonadales bacterium]